MDFNGLIAEIKTANPIRKMMLAEQLAVQLADKVVELENALDLNNRAFIEMVGRLQKLEQANAKG